MRIIHLKYQLEHRMKNLNYLMDHILYQIFKTVSNLYLKAWGKNSLSEYFTWQH